MNFATQGIQHVVDYPLFILPKFDESDATQHEVLRPQESPTRWCCDPCSAVGIFGHSGFRRKLLSPHVLFMHERILSNFTECTASVVARKLSYERVVIG